MAGKSPKSAIADLARIFWMFGGPGVLFILAFNIADQKDGWAATTGLAFLAVLVAVVVARFLDPYNAYGDPATPTEQRRSRPVPHLWAWRYGGIVNIL
ncbi:MAG: hypothetical protein AB7G28_17655 [Pirellulales bacterium]